MKAVLIGIAMALGLSLHAQTAKVIPLTAAESAEARSLHEQQKEIARKLDELEQRIQTAHLLDKSSSSPNSLGGVFFNWLTGWPNGAFEYSEDFKFIVPALRGVTFGPTQGSSTFIPFVTTPSPSSSLCCGVASSAPGCVCAIAN